MKPLNKLRNITFWIIDYLKGGYVRKDFLEINQIFNLNSFSSLQQQQKPILNNLLKTTVNNSAYYASYKNFKKLADFPVVNKLIIKNHFNEITFNNKKEEFISVTTSGSTGSPFKIYQTKRKKTRNTADTLFFAKLSGYTLGQKLLYLRLWSAYHKKNKIISWLQNTEQLDVSDLNDDTYLKNLMDKLQTDKSTKGWLGYASGFETICKYLDRINSKPLNCNVTSIIAIAERLNPEVKSKMQYYFNVPTVSRYSNVENGIIAQQMLDDDCFTINWGSYIVEILDLEKDKPAKNGEIGRIVVTDLYNLATPMIRYDTGDIGAFNLNTTDTIPKLKSIQGRKMDALFTTNGNLLNPFILHTYVYAFPEIKEIQFIQHEEKKYQIKINTSINFESEKLLIEKFKKDIGDGALIDINYVDEIPCLKSGKRKISVNLYKN
ncbi:hypothetical protein APS56_06200 [Pseudalgibacter alginicilyticus]|uniref:CoF synthetase n=1 Tax=Pseudalgibacter alginicilyticus TaxID=1736674 RepID=A0A0P0D1J9_9FLAO|nr:hypothetical protein [Pseudalgibacter alginicilyticus]ALJ04741.1 hypothetical protein APS56_06200 [Pseudalgibacter alginicilyticus]